MRVVDAKDVNTLLDPIDEDVSELGPQRLPVGTLEFKWIDVLVFLRRIFGVLNCAIWAPAEPLGMLGNIRVIRRRLKGDVEGDFEAMFSRRAYEVLELLQRS